MNAFDHHQYQLIILPADYQLAYLKNRQPGWHAPQRLYTKEALLRGLFFGYDEGALLHVMRRQTCSLSWAKTLLEELYFLSDDSTGSSRIATLTTILRELQNLNKLQIDFSFAKAFFGKKALVIGYHHQDPEIVMIGKRLGLSLDYPELGKTTLREVIQCSSLREEVHHAYNQISRLIDEGIPMNHISILCPDSDYDFELRWAAIHFQLPINFISRDCYLDTMIGKRAMALYEAEGASRDITGAIIKEFGLDGDHPVIQAIKDINIIDGHPHERIQFLKERLASLKIEPIGYQDAISQITTPYPINQQHIFVLGAKQGIIPRLQEPRGYLTDEERRLIGCLTTSLKNENEANQWRYFLNEQKHLYLSFNRGHEGENYPSPLFNELGYHITKFTHDSIEYGGIQARFRLAAMLDQKRVYHLENDLIDAYQQQLKIPYRDYDYRYRPFDAGLSQAPLALAYTGIKTFYQCRYRYYLDYILRLDAREDTFFIRLGNLTHGLLEAMYQPKFDFDSTFNQLQNEYPFNTKELVLVAGMKKDLRAVIDFNLRHQDHMKEPIITTEVKAQFSLDDKTTFKGKIDKVIVIESGDRHYVAIVDYKTGSEIFQPQKLAYGSSMQLPTYALLLAHTPGYEDYSLLGYYIQSIIPSSRHQKSEDFKLKGRSLADPVALGSFDDTIARSEFIKGLALKANDGVFYKNAPVDQKDQFEAYQTMTLDLIKKANEAIRNSDFAIDPKKLGRDEYSCQYCPFRDVCFRPDEAVTTISLTVEDIQDGPDVE